MSFNLCPNCHQHHIEADCPHCKNKPSPKLPLAALMGLSLNACIGIAPQPKYGVPEYDYDEDGYFEYEDCDDENVNAYPGAAPEDSESACMEDADGDGYGNATPQNENIEAGTDCDDSDASVNPGAENCENDAEE